MPRRLRKDEPGAWHHVVNRGIARRTIFETRRDMRMFLAALAWRVRAGEIELHAYALLPNHFHLLLRSPEGRLSVAMQRAMDSYARWFNRTRDRDGPVFTSRFVNRIVDSDSYWDAVLRYIDRNPVDAGLATSPADYPYGSAWHYAHPGGPPWLTRGEVEAHVRSPGSVHLEPGQYRAFCEQELPPGARWLVGRRLEGPGTGRRGAVDSLVRAAPPVVRAWMVERARKADGTGPGEPLVAPATIRGLVEEARLSSPGLRAGARRNSPSTWDVLLVGLLRRGSGLRLQEIGSSLCLSRTTARNRLHLFRGLILQDSGFLDRATDLLGKAMALDHGPCPPPRRKL